MQQSPVSKVKLGHFIKFLIVMRLLLKLKVSHTLEGEGVWGMPFMSFGPSALYDMTLWMLTSHK